MIELTQEFTFDAAHYLDGAPEYRRMHGQAGEAEGTRRGEPNPETGFLRDFGELDTTLKAIR